MTRAYDESYLDDAMRNLGEAFDYAVDKLKLSLDEFSVLFIESGLARQFGHGSPKYVAGMSGTELAMEVLTKTKKQTDFPESVIDYEPSSDYWCGWILAFYQWYTGRSFEEIRHFISMSEIEKLYPTLHEASEEKFVDTAESIIKRKTS